MSVEFLFDKTDVEGRVGEVDVFFIKSERSRNSRL